MFSITWFLRRFIWWNHGKPLLQCPVCTGIACTQYRGARLKWRKYTKITRGLQCYHVFWRSCASTKCRKWLWKRRMLDSNRCLLKSGMGKFGTHAALPYRGIELWRLVVAQEKGRPQGRPRQKFEMSHVEDYRMLEQWRGGQERSEEGSHQHGKEEGSHLYPAAMEPNILCEAISYLQNNRTTVIARSGSCDVFSRNGCVKYDTETGSMRLEKCEFEALNMNIKSIDFKLISKCLVMYVLQMVGTLDSSASMNKYLCAIAATVVFCALVMELFQATAVDQPLHYELMALSMFNVVLASSELLFIIGTSRFCLVQLFACRDRRPGVQYARFTQMMVCVVFLEALSNMGPVRCMARHEHVSRLCKRKVAEHIYIYMIYMFIIYNKLRR